MTGMPTLLVQLEDAAGVFNQDITQYANLAPSWTARRGRNDEETGIEPGRLEMLLDNSDGKFTLGSASFGGITVDKRIRVSETVGGVTTKRHTGYVQDWPTEWESPLGNTAVCRITSMDRLSRLNRRKLRSTTEQEILLDGPYAYYTLGEVAGSTLAGDTSGNGRASLAITGPGTAPTFGAAAPNSWDGITGCAFAGLAGQYLLAPSVFAPVSTSVSILFYAAITSVSLLQFLVALQDPITGTEVSVGLDSTGQLAANRTNLGGPNFADGVPHLFEVTLAGTALNVYVDGNLVLSPTTTGVVAGRMYNLAVGQALAGTMAHVAVFNGVNSAARILAHANAVRNGFATDRFDQRLARLASYANIAPADQSLETGQTPSIAAASTTDQNVLPAMNDVADAEGGLVFIAGDGQLVGQNKSHRPLKATSAAALAITAADVVAGSLKFAGAKDYLVNDATSTRPGGAEQRSVNTASVNAYEEYPGETPTTLLPTDELVLNRLTWLTTMYGTPMSRVKEFTLDLLTLPQATVQAALALEIGDRVTISSLPSQAPSSPDLLIEGITEVQQASVSSKPKWELTFNTVPAALFRPWILSDPTYGQLGITTRLYY